MLNTREWFAQTFGTEPEQPFYSFVLDEPNDLSMTPVAAYPQGNFFRWDTENIEWITPEQEIIRILAEHFKQVPEVQFIYAQFLPEEMAIWTILDAYNPEARSAVHAKELEICRMLKLFDFDFRVTSADIVSPSELVGNGLHEIYNRSRSSSG